MYKNKGGKHKEIKKFWIEVVDRREKGFRKVLRFPASESESLSEKLGGKIQELIDYAAMDNPNPKLIDWFQDYAPKKLQERLIEVGLLPPSVKDADKPLIDYLPDFQQAIFQESQKSRQKKVSTTDAQARTTIARVRKLIDGCGFKRWRDVSSEKVNEYVGGRPDGISQQTAHFYVQSFRRFAGWMQERGYIDKAPKINSVSVPRNYGRAFELDEFERLLEAAKTGPEHYGLTGHQRYILYLLACETGLRRGELRSLTVASIDLKTSCLFVKGADTKNKDEAVQYFTPETGRLLQEYIRGKMPNVKLFPIHDKSSKMIQTDCEAAGIEVENHKGKLNFHSLRHTCGSYLAAHGVEPKLVMEIMRHKDINLTMSRYTHLLSGQKQNAVNKLPRFGKSEAEEKSA
jgi:integrase